ncbi:hypothetical protein [Nocardioides sp.]|uniref:hypothetical protein n=1 Tax=Nocardioides sp. TaxID=35761 RepID=UPI002CEB7AE8|nr:hypothetical protein [Nocardioides sp.]HSX66670.1 hypothetical protein [Nocardioides sp.]
MTSRDVIAGAINNAGIPGAAGATVNVTARYRQTLTPFEGFVRLARKAIDDSRLGFMDTWQIWLALPQDVATAEEWIDNHGDALLAAVNTEATALDLTPSVLVLDANSVPGIVITAAREG